MVSLIYHDVVRVDQRDGCGFPGKVAGLYKLEPSDFSAHLAAIAATGARAGLYDERPPVVLTFDDGGASSLWIAEELERHGWRGMFFVVTQRVGTPGFVSSEDVRKLVASGHEVGSHSHTHPAYMARLDGEALADEWSTSREILAEMLGAAPRTAAVPGGSVSPEVVRRAAEAGYTRLFTSTPTVRARVVHGIEVVGRFTVWGADRSDLVAALVTGAGAARARRSVAWQVKSAAKRVAPGTYELARRLRAKRRTFTG